MLADKQGFQGHVSMDTFGWWRSRIAKAIVSWACHGQDFVVSTGVMDI